MLNTFFFCYCNVLKRAILYCKEKRYGNFHRSNNKINRNFHVIDLQYFFFLFAAEKNLLSWHFAIFFLTIALKRGLQVGFIRNRIKRSSG